jgi:Domain of Unknown Function with PDB structure (DUF3857)/Transglutaminase-like superfamily
MRRNRVLPFLCLPALLLVPAIASAQFQQPSSDELKMTSDPANPGATAVYLNLEEKTDDTVHYTSRYARIKILSEAAKELATVHLGYFKGGSTIADVSGRTIHPDGTIVPLSVKPADLMRAKEGESELHEVVFNLPSVEVGSIIEFYYQIRSTEYACHTPYWQVQGPYPVRKAHYLFTPCEGILEEKAGRFSNGVVDEHGQMLSDLMWYVHLPPGKTIAPSVAHRFDLSVENIPALPNESWMPPIESQRYEVRFYFAPGNSATAYWNNEAHYWIKDVDHFAELTHAVKSGAQELGAGADAPLDKAKKLYAAVQAFDNTDFSRKKSDAERKAEGLKGTKHAEDVLLQKSGSSEEIALTYLALLRASGLSAYPMKVVDRRTGIFNAGYLSFRQLNGTVVILNIDGKDMVLDPGEKMCPFGLVIWHHAGAGGVRQTDKGIDSWATPLNAYADNVVTRRAELTVAASGGVTGKLQFGMTGQEALRWRQRALREDEDALKKDFDDWLKTQIGSGLEAHVTRFNRLDDPSGELAAYASVTGSAGSVTGKRILLPASFFMTGEDRTFISQPNRQLPVDMHFAAQVKDGVLYHLPAGYTLEAALPPSSVPWPDHAVYQLKATSGANGVTVVDTLARAFTFVQPDEYPALRNFYQKVSAADQQQLVFSATAAPATGGN